MRDHLSFREIQIIDLASRGHSVAGTAKELHIAPTTVKTHRQRIISKWGCGGKGMTYVTTLAFRRGILIPEYPPRPHPFSPTRMAILIGVANGRTNAQIGEDRNITEDTVKTHMRAMLKNSHTTNRTHLIGWSFRNGTLVLIPPRPPRDTTK